MDTRFQVCFTPLAAVLFAFPSRYLFAIGHHGVFSLGEWSPLIRTGFHVSRPTWDARRRGAGFRPWGFHPLRLRFPADRPSLPPATSGSLNPGGQAPRFGLVRFRSPLLAQSLRFPFLRVLRCFTSPGVAPAGLLGSSRGAATLVAAGFPIRKSADQCPQAAPRGLSRPDASFFAS